MEPVLGERIAPDVVISVIGCSKGTPVSLQTVPLGIDMATTPTLTGLTELLALGEVPEPALTESDAAERFSSPSGIDVGSS